MGLTLEKGNVSFETLSSLLLVEEKKLWHAPCWFLPPTCWSCTFCRIALTEESAASSVYLTKVTSLFPPFAGVHFLASKFFSENWRIAAQLARSVCPFQGRFAFFHSTYLCHRLEAYPDTPRSIRMAPFSNIWIRPLASTLPAQFLLLFLVKSEGIFVTGFSR